MTDFQNDFRNKKILITGATGFTGAVLTQKLIDAGALLTLIVRESSNTKAFEGHDNVTIMTGNLIDSDLITKACEGIEYIFHIAAAFREEKSSVELFRDVHVRSTQLLAKAVQGQAQFKSFIHVSTVGIYSHIEQGQIADEHYRIKPGDDYQLTKLEGEQWLTEYAKENPLPYTIIRPAPIYGPGDRRLLKFYKMVYYKNLLMLGKRNPDYHLIHVDDLTNVMMKAAITPQAQSEDFIVASDDCVKIEKMGAIIAKAYDIPLKIRRFPLLPFLWLCDVVTFAFHLVKKESPLYRRRLSFYTNDRRFDNTKVKTLLNYEFKVSSEQGITETAKWYKDQNWL